MGPHRSASEAEHERLRVEHANANAELEALRLSEERTRWIIEHATNLFYSHTPEHKLTYLSPQTRAFFDCDVEEAMVHWTEFATDDPINAQGFAATVRAINTGMAQPPYRLELMGRKGRRVWVEVHEAPVVRDGKTVAIVGSLTDITARKRAEDDLMRQHALLKGIVEGTTDTLYVKDTDGRFLMANGPAAALLGLPPGEVAGLTVEEALGGEAGRALAAKDRLVLQTGRGAPWEHTVGEGEGARTFAGMNVPFRDEAGSTIGIIGFGRDVTDERRSLQEAARAREQVKELEDLRALDEFKTQFINNAAHELFTPLIPMRVQLHLLSKTSAGPLTQGQQEMVTILQRNLERLSQLVQEVLDSARLQAKRLGVQKKRCDLGRLVGEAVQTFQPAATGSGLALELRLEGEMPVLADADRVSQVLLNLLSNAVKFTPRDGKITVEALRVGDLNVVRVADTGVGLSATQIARLFQPFSQVHTAMGTSPVGTGLGLYISHGLVALHGGRLWVESPGPGRGSTFSFALPKA